MARIEPPKAPEQPPGRSNRVTSELSYPIYLWHIRVEVFATPVLSD